MKKLLLLLFFTISVNAQITQPTPYELCDIGIPNFETFDLTSKIPEILGGLNPSENSVSFYPSYANALNDTGVITTPNAYVNMIFPVMTLGVRVTNSLGEHSYTTLDIRLIPVPIANPAILSFCDIMELPIYNLDDAIPQITGGNPNVIITFYGTQTDAEAAINPIEDGGYIPLINPGTQILYARVQNAQSGCYSVTSLALNTHNCNTTSCLPPTNLTATIITQTSATFSWVENNASTLWEVMILPAGAPGPPVSINPGVPAQSNPYTATGLSPQTCYSFYVRSTCGSWGTGAWAGPMNFCTYDCTNTGQCAQNLTLISFLDSNNNGVKDTGETNFNIGNFEYEVNNSGVPVYAYPNDGQFYIFDTNPANSYNLSFIIDSDYSAYFSSATNYTNITLPAGSGNSTYYFPITQLQSLSDVEIQIIPNGTPRPGFTYSTIISYKNKGTEMVSSGTLTFTKSPVVSIVNISQAGTNTITTGFDYTFSNLAPSEQRYIYVQMQVPTIPTVNLGDILTHSASITPLTGDAFPANNNVTLSQTIIGSYDPNDKAESHGGRIVFADFTSNDYLYYTIRFENTGTASAEFIRVEDVLDAKLDETTFEMLDASHDVNTRREGNNIVWHFYGIDLPPSSININDGHGYVFFRIKPKAGYTIGDVIPNTASIFFDYNPPIVTDPFYTEFVESLGNPVFETNQFVLFPNPAHDIITIKSSMERIASVNIYDISGKRIHATVENHVNETNINVANFVKGIYLVEINNENNIRNIKKLVIQ